jgi:hypothetical protein
LSGQPNFRIKLKYFLIRLPIKQNVWFFDATLCYTDKSATPPPVPDFRFYSISERYTYLSQKLFPFHLSVQISQIYAVNIAYQGQLSM